MFYNIYTIYKQPRNMSESDDEEWEDVPVQQPLSMAQVNAAAELMRATGRNLNGPEHVSEAAALRRELVQSQNLRPTIYYYVVPQESATLCNQCQLSGDDRMEQSFAGHNENRLVDRHLLCRTHYNDIHSRHMPCPSCRSPLNTWTHPKVVQIAANGTETVLNQGHAGGKRNNRKRATRRRHNRKRATRRRHNRKRATRRR
jgi:hypothetical protein